MFYYKNLIRYVIILNVLLAFSVLLNGGHYQPARTLWGLFLFIVLLFIQWVAIHYYYVQEHAYMPLMRLTTVISLILIFESYKTLQFSSTRLQTPATLAVLGVNALFVIIVCTMKHRADNPKVPTEKKRHAAPH